MASGKLRESAAMQIDATVVMTAGNADASLGRAMRSALFSAGRKQGSGGDGERVFARPSGGKRPRRQTG